VNPVAQILYAVSFAMLAACAWLVAQWGIRRARALYAERQRVTPPYADRDAPIYSRLANEHPDVVPILADARRFRHYQQRRQVMLRMTASTRGFTIKMQEVNRALAALGKRLGDQTYGATRQDGDGA
jgi:hypothetical protein